MLVFQNVAASCSDERPAAPWNSTELPKKLGKHLQTGFPTIAIKHRCTSARSTPRKNYDAPASHGTVNKRCAISFYSIFQLDTTVLRGSKSITASELLACSGSSAVYLQDDPVGPKYFLLPPRLAPPLLTRANQAPWSAA